jgi:hypothetical protein
MVGDALFVNASCNNPG